MKTEKQKKSNIIALYKSRKITRYTESGDFLTGGSFTEVDVAFLQDSSVSLEGCVDSSEGRA